MFKKTLFAIAFVSLFSCEQGNVDEIIEQEVNTTTSETQKNLFSFKNWDDFNTAFINFSELDTEELKTVSFYNDERSSEFSDAFNAILNEDYQFEVANKIIWLHNGAFYELDDSTIQNPNANISTLKKVGSITTDIVPIENEYLERGTVAINNQKEFRKQRYVEGCGSGKVQGPSPRAFKYVNEAYAETARIGNQNYHSLYLRIKLEYNHRRRSWRLSGESREISVNATNSSYIRTASAPIAGLNYTIIKNISFNSGCSSHKNLLLSRLIAPFQIHSIQWAVKLNGTVTQKMLGDVETNRWTNYINWQ
ncbi:hypothetical protein [Tenacibaculum agarivorans]|uniref:hypothetical protein n=1 Tax=Tenacibaculum agarivorans TaxID=1908389 RepID=UPI00094B9278|nr:hypothetical protein [Tenacibaculum agarivorans]